MTTVRTVVNDDYRRRLNAAIRDAGGVDLSEWNTRFRRALERHGLELRPAPAGLRDGAPYIAPSSVRGYPDGWDFQTLVVDLGDDTNWGVK